MDLYKFALGTTSSPDRLDAMTPEVFPPDWTFTECVNPVTLASGQVRNLGWGLITWHWGFLEREMRDVLRILCPGPSAEVYLISPDNSRTFNLYQALMVWPAGEDPTADLYRDVTIEFRRPVLIEESV